MSTPCYCPCCRTCIDLSEADLAERVECKDCGHVFRPFGSTAESAATTLPFDDALPAMSQSAQPTPPPQSVHSTLPAEHPLAADAAGLEDDPGGIPAVIGRFQMRARLGAGAFGTVFRAHDPRLDREVALKIPRSGVLLGNEEVQRFLREARAAAQLRHPHVVQVHEAGQIAGVPYIASAFIEGTTLREQIDSGWRPTHREAAHLVAKIAAALHYAHNRGIIHRDVKPGNVMLDTLGEPMVMDFGLAHREEPDVLRTQEGVRMGTPAYMSPEQARGESHLADARSDLWSLGVMLYELLAGKRPFAGRGEELLAALQHGEPESLLRRGSRVSRDLATICQKCLAKEPERRYPSAQHLADELERWLRGDPIEARPAGAGERAIRFIRRYPLRVAVVAAAVVVASAMAAYRGTRPAYLDLRVEPRGARATLGGEPLDLTDGRTLAAWPPGRFDLDVTAPGFVAQRRQVILVRGRDNAALVDVRLVSNCGHLQVESVPSGAAVEVLDARGPVAARGATPYLSPRLPAGKYTLRLTKELCEPQEMPVTVPDGDRVVEVPKVILATSIPGVTNLDRLLQFRAWLSKPLAEPWSLRQLPLERALALIAETEDVDLLLDRKALDDRGIAGDMPVTFSARQGEPLLGALDLLLRRMGLTVIPVPGAEQLQLEVTTFEGEYDRLQTVVYPVGDLLTDWPEGGVVDEVTLQDAVTSLIAPQSWNLVGGSAVAKGLRGLGALSVTQTWRNLLHIDDYLMDLRRAKAAMVTGDRLAMGAQPNMFNALLRRDEEATPTDVWQQLLLFREELSRPIAKRWQFEKLSLQDVLRRIGEETGWEFHLDVEQLARAGIAKDVRVTRAIEVKPVSAALDELLPPLGLAWVPRFQTPATHGAGHPARQRVPIEIEITTPDEAKRRLVLINYPVADALSHSERLGGDYDTLISELEKEVAPKSWDTVGGSGTIVPLPGLAVLSVRQTFPGHAAVHERLLERRSRLQEREKVHVADASAAPPVGPTIAAPAERRRQYEQLSEQLDAATGESDREEARRRLVSFGREQTGRPEAILAAERAARVPWPADRLRRDQLSAEALAAAGRGDPQQAPSTLVAAVGDARMRHWGAVRCLALDPAQTLIASAGSDGTLVLWDVAAERARCTLPEDGASVTSLAFSPDGRLLAVGTGQNEIALWDVAAERRAAVLQGHLGAIRVLRFSPDGKLLVSGGQDLTVRAWDVRDTASTGLRHTWTGHAQPVSRVIVGEDNRTVVSGANDGIILLWDAQSAEPIQTLTGHEAPILSLVLSAEGNRLTSAATNWEVREWELPGGESRRLFSAPEAVALRRALVNATLTRDGRLLMVLHTGDGVDRAILVDWTELKRMLPLLLSGLGSAPSRAVGALSSDGEVLAIGSRQGQVRLGTIQEAPKSGASKSAKSGELSVPEFWQRISSQWKLTSPRPVGSPGSCGHFSCAAVRADGQWLALAGTGPSILWDLETGMTKATLYGQWRSVDFSPDGRTLALGGARRVALWDMDREQTRNLESAGFSRAPTVFGVGGRWLARATFGTSSPHPTKPTWTINLLDVNTGEQVQQIRWRGTVSEAMTPMNVLPNSLAVAPDDHFLAAAIARMVEVYNVATGQRTARLEGHDGTVTAVAWNPDGQWLVSADDEGTVMLWKTSNYQQHTQWKAESRITSLSYRYDGRVLASSHADGTVRLWDAGSGNLRRIIRVGPPEALVYQVAFTPEGRHLVSVNSNGTAYVLRLESAGNQ